MKIDFQSQYEILGLTPQTDWKTVQATYRKLVHEWHPDRHRDNDENSRLAERKFIQLTQAFNNLRDFYRTNDRLPLQRPATASYPGSTENESAHDQTPGVSDQDLTDSGLLSGKRSTRKKKRPSILAFLSKHFFLIGAAAVMVFALMTMALMYKLDKRHAQIAKTERKNMMKNLEPSKFERSALEVQRAVTTGAFLEARPESSALGNQIRGDSFSRNKKKRY